MYSRLLENSYIMFALSFLVFFGIFYLFNIGTTQKVVNGKMVNRPGWKYPLALALIIWLIWHFRLYPPKEVIGAAPKSKKLPTIQTTQPTQPTQPFCGMQHIQMRNWT